MRNAKISFFAIISVRLVPSARVAMLVRLILKISVSKSFRLLFNSSILGDAAGQLAVFVHLEPVGLGAGLHLAVAQQLVDLLAGELAVGHAVK